MRSPASHLWFSFSLTLAPEIVPQRLEGLTLPRLPEGAVAEALDMDLLYDVPTPDWDGHVARLVETPGKRVMGRLRALPAENWLQVARLEERLCAATVERWVRVRTPSGDLYSARAFTAPAPVPTPGPVSESFLVALAQAAEHAKLPADYVSRLQSEAWLVRTVQRAHTQRVR